MGGVDRAFAAACVENSSTSDIIESANDYSMGHDNRSCNLFLINPDPAMGDVMAASPGAAASKEATLFVATTGAVSDSPPKKYTYGKIGC